MAAAVAAGEAELGITFTSELAPTPGVKVAGTLPADIQLPTIYAGAVVANAGNADAARAFLRALAGAEGRAALKKAGLEPVATPAPLSVPVQADDGAGEVVGADRHVHLAIGHRHAHGHAAIQPRDQRVHQRAVDRIQLQRLGVVDPFTGQLFQELRRGPCACTPRPAARLSTPCAGARHRACRPRSTP